MFPYLHALRVQALVLARRDKLSGSFDPWSTCGVDKLCYGEINGGNGTSDLQTLCEAICDLRGVLDVAGLRRRIPAVTSRAGTTSSLQAMSPAGAL